MEKSATLSMAHTIIHCGTYLQESNPTTPHEHIMTMLTMVSIKCVNMQLLYAKCNVAFTLHDNHAKKMLSLRQLCDCRTIVMRLLHVKCKPSLRIKIEFPHFSKKTEVSKNVSGFSPSFY